MKEETKKAFKELKTTLIVVVLFIIIAALLISIYSRTNIGNAFGTVIFQMLSAGTGGTLGNIFYVVLLFLTLGFTFYMFQNLIILLTNFRIGGVLMKAKLSSIKNHYIVCGGGKVGMHAAERLKSEGEKVVIIENDLPTVEFLENRGYVVIEGDCMSEEILEKAKIRTAKGILACTGKDNINVFLVLISRDLNPNIRIATRVNEQKARDEFKRAGADIIVMPDITGGYELADKISAKK